jgi:predicted nucleic acid-binding Zn ribbon protein
MKINIKYPKAKCAYCGKEYTKTHNRQMYCSDECRKNSRKEKRRIYDSRYYYKNRYKRNYTLIGTRCIGPHKHPDDDREAEIVQNEIRRHQLHIF